MIARVAWALSTIGGLGDLLPAPGTTVGSLLAALAGYLLLRRFPHAPAVLLAALLVLLPVAIWACGAEAERRGLEDPGAVVLDEVAGQWLALGAVATTGLATASAPTVAVSYVLFRAFDVIKPWPVRRLERLPGGLGVVADDLAAGLLAALVHAAGLLLLAAARR